MRHPLSRSIANRDRWQQRLSGLAFIITLSLTCAVSAQVSELADAKNAVAPIEHQPFFRGERELFGYAPKFEPNPVGFSPEGQPYIRVGSVVQTPDHEGGWTRLPISPSIVRHYQRQGSHHTHEIVGGPFVDHRVIFDDAGNAYTLAKVNRAGKLDMLLLYSRDRCVSWEVYKLPPLKHARLEFRDGHNTMTRPPAVLVFEDQELNVVLPRRAEDGSLLVDRAATVTHQSKLVQSHSGAGNAVITLGDRVFVVYPSSVPPPGQEGTSQYVVALSRDTGHILSGPTLLGTVGVGPPDPHYLPAITADSRGVLHVVLGSHHNSLYYVKSLSPNDASRWTTPKRIGKTRNPRDGGHTYPALLCDPEDRLHVVSRWAGDGYYFRLVYLRGNAQTGRWKPQKVLVRPFRNMYSNWYHQMNIDRRGRLFLNYRYYGNQLNAEQMQAYRLKWPEDKLPTDAPPGVFARQIKSHDPAMLFSNDGGLTWRLTTTEDLSSR